MKNRVSGYVRIKRWWLQKNNMYASCPCQIREGRYTEYSWLHITFETERAYHFNGMQRYIPQIPFVPKSAVLEFKYE